MRTLLPVRTSLPNARDACLGGKVPLHFQSIAYTGAVGFDAVQAPPTCVVSPLVDEAGSGCIIRGSLGRKAQGSSELDSAREMIFDSVRR